MLRQLQTVLLVAWFTLAGQTDDTIRTSELDLLPEDPAAAMVAGIDRFLLNEIEAARTERSQFWNQTESKQSNIDYLKQQLGLEPKRSFAEPFIQSPPLHEIALSNQQSSVKLHAVRWPVLPHPSPLATIEAGGNAASDDHRESPPSLWGDGILWLPSAPNGSMIVFVSHSGQSSLVDENGKQRQRYCIAMAAKGYAVLEVSTVGHDRVQHGAAKLSRREYLHRSAFELGRTLVGYEIQTIQSAVDWLRPFLLSEIKRKTASETSAIDHQVILIGWGEGGRTALLTAAVDSRIDLIISHGYFGPREQVWQEPIDRTIQGVLNRFGDAELVAAIAPRSVILHAYPMFSVEQSGDGGGAPGHWQSPSVEQVRSEFSRLENIGVTNARLVTEDLTDSSIEWKASSIDLSSGKTADVANDKSLSPS